MLKVEITLPHSDINLLETFAEKHGANIIEKEKPVDKPATFSLEIDVDNIDLKYPCSKQKKFKDLSDKDQLSHAFAKFVHDEMGFQGDYPVVGNHFGVITVGHDKAHENPSGTYLDIEKGDALKMSLVHEIFTKEDSDLSNITPDDPLYDLNL